MTYRPLREYMVTSHGHLGRMVHHCPSPALAARADQVARDWWPGCILHVVDQVTGEKTDWHWTGEYMVHLPGGFHPRKLADLPPQHRPPIMALIADAIEGDPGEGHEAGLE